MTNITVPEKYWAECPKCGKEVRYEKFQYDGGRANTVEFQCIGNCPDCGKVYAWREKFVLTEITFLEDLGFIDCYE